MANVIVIKTKCWQINHVPANNKLTEENRRHVVVVCLLSQLRLHGVNTCQRVPNLPSVTIFRTISRNQEVSYCRISGGGASNLSSLRRCSCQLVARRVESISQVVTLLVAVCSQTRRPRGFVGANVGFPAPAHNRDALYASTITHKEHADPL